MSIAKKMDLQDLRASNNIQDYSFLSFLKKWFPRINGTGRAS
jgi:hypothetical protein